jgi:hypothetical protein
MEPNGDPSCWARMAKEGDSSEDGDIGVLWSDVGIIFSEEMPGMSMVYDKDFYGEDNRNIISTRNSIDPLWVRGVALNEPIR